MYEPEIFAPEESKEWWEALKLWHAELDKEAVKLGVDPAYWPINPHRVAPTTTDFMGDFEAGKPAAETMAAYAVEIKAHIARNKDRPAFIPRRKPQGPQL